MDDPLHSLIDTDEVLQPYLAAAKDLSNVSTLRSLIMKVLSDSHVFVGYNEIHALVKTHIQGSPDGEKLMNTLDLFSFGSYSDYMNSTDQFISLNESQIFKLKQLTAMTLIEQACQNKTNSISYDTIQQNLDLENANQVERVLVSCIYSRVLIGKLNQKTKTLQLSSAFGPPLCPRDVPVSKISDMLAAVQAIKSNIADCQQQLSSQHAYIRKEHNAQTRFFTQVEARMKRAEAACRDIGGSSAPMLQAQRRGSGWGAFGGGAAAVMAGGDDPMDVGPISSRRQKRSRGGLSGVGENLAGGFRFNR